MSNIIKILFFFSGCAQFAIGRVYDDRLSIFGINISLINFFLYIFLAITFISFIKKIEFYSKSKLILYLFYSGILIINPILWLIHGVSEYGLSKYFNFITIAIPISIIVIEKFSYKDVLMMCKILFSVTILLSFLALFGIAISENPDQRRLSVLGGGPIIFSRWMGYGILLLIFSPIRIHKILKITLIIIFFVLAFASGSRAPVLSIILVLVLFFILNFKGIFTQAFLYISAFFIILFSFNITQNISDLGKVERVFMNLNDVRSINNSTGTRMILLEGSSKLLKAYPLGVGSGNYQAKINEMSPNKMVPLEYPHNIILEIANEQGIFMAFIFILLFIYSISLSFQRMRVYKENKSSLYPFLFYMIVYFSINISISGDINDARIWFLFISFLLIESPLISRKNDITNKIS